MNDRPQSVTPAGAGARTIPQGMSIMGVLEALQAFDVWHPTIRQYGITLTLGTGLAAFLMRVVEARIGHAWLRTVDPPRFP